LAFVYFVGVDICMAHHNEKSSISLSQMSGNETIKRALFEAIASWLVDSKTTEVNLIGTPDQIGVVRKAMIESKKFQDELSNPYSTIDLISERLNSKLMAAHSFESTFGTQWLL